MQPIHELLNRIRWDESFGQGDFKIGYYDRIEDRIILLSLQDLEFDPAEPSRFTVLDENLKTRHIPLHRIKEVYKNGRLIWQREH